MSDSSAKRQNIASKAVAASTAIVDNLNVLLELKDERAKLVDPFVDGDFTGTALKHLTAAQIGVLFDFVVPALQTTYLDTNVPASTNGGRNQQILLQMRG